MASSFSWQNLPIDILPHICEKLDEIADRIQFSAVSHEWRQIHFRCCEGILPQPPLLLRSSLAGNNLVRNDIIFSTSNKHGCFNIKLPFKYCSRAYLGANYGWLIAMSGDHIELLNPFLSVNNVIKLPILPNDVNWSSFAILSHNPTWTSNYLVFIIYSSINNERSMKTSFAYLKSGETSWNSVYVGSAIHSSIYYNDKFYMLCYDEVIMCFDIATSSTLQPTVTNVASWPDIRVHLGDFTSLHLVESRGELLCVAMESTEKKRSKIAKLFSTCIYREEQMDDHFTTGCQIFKYEIRNNIWTECTSLEGGQAVFIGHNSCLSVDVSNFPDCMPNHIYFQFAEEIEVGVYNVEDASFKVLGIKGKGSPIWIQPTLNTSEQMIFGQSGAKKRMLMKLETNEREMISTPYVWDWKCLFFIVFMVCFLVPNSLKLFS